MIMDIYGYMIISIPITYCIFAIIFVIVKCHNLHRSTHIPTDKDVNKAKLSISLNYDKCYIEIVINDVKNEKATILFTFEK